MKRNMKSKILFIIFYLKRFKIKIESSQINNNTPNGGDNEKDTQNCSVLCFDNAFFWCLWTTTKDHFIFW